MFAQFLRSYASNIGIYELTIGKNYWLHDKLSVFMTIYYVFMCEKGWMALSGMKRMLFPGICL